MKAWEPEETFEKADFPAKKPGDDSKPDAKRKPGAGGKTGAGRPGRGAGEGERPGSQSGPQKSPPVSGAPKKFRPPPARPAPGPSAGVPAPPPIGQPAPARSKSGSGTAWEPDLDFERADFSGVPPEEAVARGDSRSSSDAMANVANARPGPGPQSGTPARSWQPPKLSEQARQAGKPDGGRGSAPAGSGPEKNTARTPKIVGSRIRQGPGSESGAGAASSAPLNSDLNSKTNAGSGTVHAAAGTAGVSGFSRRLLEELTILHRENARHILRHWYWEKTGMAPEGLGHIQPHDRIYVVLASLGPQVLIVLYESMSPTERRQMQEILDRPRNLTAVDANRVRTIFMQTLRAEV
ncbi:MAG: hypothetical protein NXI24_07170 [bacterium]|nr:hypothetical protein [bacterium]